MQESQDRPVRASCAASVTVSAHILPSVACTMSVRDLAAACAQFAISANRPGYMSSSTSHTSLCRSSPWRPITRSYWLSLKSTRPRSISEHQQRRAPLLSLLLLLWLKWQQSREHLLLFPQDSRAASYRCLEAMDLNQALKELE